MTCPHCESPATTKRQGPTSLGSRRFRCRSCGRRFNERSGTAFNDLQYATDVVLLAVLRRLRDKLSCRDIAEMRLERGFSVTPETIREWECRFAPRVTERLRAKRRGRAGRSWYLDETDVQVAGRWCSLDRAIDREGDLLDSRRSAHRDKHAARRFLRRLVDVAERKPQRITTDQRPPYRRAIRWILGRKVRHRCSQDLKPPHRAKPPGGEAALRPHAGLRKIRVRRALLFRVRCAPARLPRSPAPRPICPPGRAATDLRHTLAVTDGGDAGGITRAARGSA